MKRRDFVTSTAGALAAGSAGCAGVRQLAIPGPQQVTAEEMESFLIAQDGMMSRIAGGQGGGRFLSELSEGRPIGEDDARLFRQAMRSLLLVGNFRELSVEGRSHPGVQKRLRYSSPEIDSAAAGVLDRMKSMSPTARADLQLALRTDPTLGERVLKAIEFEASAVGAPARRRRELLELGSYVIGRMQHSSDVFVDEYIDKYERLAARSGSVAEMERFMAARLGRAAFQARVREAEQAARGWRTEGVRDVPIGYVLDAAGDVAGMIGREAEEQAWYSRGLKVLGVGAATTAVGWLLITIGDDGGLDVNDIFLVGTVLGITVGPITMLVGLCILLWDWTKT